MRARFEDRSRTEMRNAVFSEQWYQKHISNPEQQWQNGKAETCHDIFWVSLCLAKAGEHKA